MKRHEFEQEALQAILEKRPDDFTYEFTDYEMRENLNELLIIWATNRHDQAALSSNISRYIAWMISYQSKYSKQVDDTLTAEDIWNYHQDMKTIQWENRHDY